MVLRAWEGRSRMSAHTAGRRGGWEAALSPGPSTEWPPKSTSICRIFMSNLEIFAIQGMERGEKYPQNPMCDRFWSDKLFSPFHR